MENGTVEHIKSADSKNFHINILECKNLKIKHVVIEAPAESPNTDGIHMRRSQGIPIVNTTIGTSDGCISVSDGTSEVKITDVTCGPGHGISVGSLGKYKNEEPVIGLVVKRCKLTSMDNGVRIKTWPECMKPLHQACILKILPWTMSPILSLLIKCIAQATIATKR